MGWVAREDHHQRDVSGEVTALTVSALASHGITVTTDPTSTRDEPVLVDERGEYRFGLGNVIAVCRTEPAGQWPEIIGNHVSRITQAVTGPQIEDLTADEVRALVRTRLVTSEFAEAHNFGYARPVTDHLMLALALDMPETVTTLGSGNIERLPVPIEELFAIGQQNTNMEVIDEHVTVADGSNVWALTGDSHFIAAQIADMGSLIENRIRSAPLGVVFGVPNRSMLLYTAPRGESAMKDIAVLFDLVAAFANQYPEPPGRLSPVTYYWDGKGVSTAGGVDDTGGIILDASGAFGRLLERFGVTPRPDDQ